MAMPQDFTPDALPIPELPRLCPDHKPVIGNAAHLDHHDHHDVDNARAERARQCPDCYRLNGRTLR